MSPVTGPGAELNDAIALNDLEGDFFKIANNKITGKTIAEVPPGSPGLITAPPAGTPANSTLAADGTWLPAATYHHHRVTLPDFPTVTAFNGNSYAIARWIPVISGVSYTRVTGVNPAIGAGLNFRANAGGNWELYGDVQGFAERWVVDLIFIRITSAIVQRFGTFT